MWRNFNEEWERKKYYLIRSLFQDVPILSPVYETQEHSDNSSSEVHSARSYSPLPPLIIEREPNRHDEPEEYYIQLEKRMKKLYKKLFFANYDERNDTSREKVTEYTNNNDCPNFEYNTSNLAEESLNKREYRKGSDSTECSKSSTSSEYVVIQSNKKTPSDKSKVEEESVDENLNKSTTSDESVQSADSGGEVEKSDHDSEDLSVEEKFESHKVAGSQASNENEEKSLDVGENDCYMEVVRSNKSVSPSLGSLQNENISFRLPLLIETEHPDDILFTSPKEMNIASESPDFQALLTNTSTPKMNISVDKFDNRKRVSESFNDSSSFHSTSLKRRIENIEEQTCNGSKRNGQDWNSLKTNLFLGAPKFFKLCSCREHICQH